MISIENYLTIQPVMIAYQLDLLFTGGPRGLRGVAHKKRGGLPFNFPNHCLVCSLKYRILGLHSKNLGARNEERFGLPWQFLSGLGRRFGCVGSVSFRPIILRHG